MSDYKTHKVGSSARFNAISGWAPQAQVSGQPSQTWALSTPLLVRPSPVPSPVQDKNNRNRCKDFSFGLRLQEGPVNSATGILKGIKLTLLKIPAINSTQTPESEPLRISRWMEGWFSLPSQSSKKLRRCLFSKMYKHKCRATRIIRDDLAYVVLTNEQS